MRNILILVCIFFATAVNATDILSPWGVASHPMWQSEWDNMEKSFSYVQSSGIKMMREDFALSRISRVKGQYDFSRYDKIISEAEKYGFTFLPILEAYDHELDNAGRKDIIPIYDHPEEWRQFVKEVATRYKGKLKYWEIWNEEDRGFWKPAPNAAQYVKILKIAYEEIKKVDPESTVILGGLTYWNADYLQAVYNVGGKNYFDAVAVHAYDKAPDVNKREVRERKEFYKVLKANNAEHLPIFITEFGGTTFQSHLYAQELQFVEHAIEYSLSKLGKDLKIKDITIGLALSPRAGILDEIDAKRAWLPNKELKLIPFEHLAALDPKDVPVLIGGEGLNVDEPLLSPLGEYIKKGGLVLGHDMVPFHTVHYVAEDGTWQNQDRPHITYPAWRMNFEAWWTMPNVPQSTMKVETSEDGVSFGLPKVNNVYVDRFFTNKNMKAGDKYYPIIKAFNSTSTYVGDGMSLYTYGDWKGGVLLSSIRLNTGYSEEEQANLLHRNFLVYLSLGIKAMYWYDLHNDGAERGEREHNFGLINWNWVPKPSYYAYQQMTNELGQYPIFKERLALGDDDVWGLVFERKEDKNKVLALWAVNGQEKVTINNVTIYLEGASVQFIKLNKDGEILAPEAIEHPILIDFGGISSPSPWNNLGANDFLHGRLDGLYDEKQNRTSVSLEITKAFSSSDNSGVKLTNNGLPSTVTEDHYVGDGKDSNYSELVLSGFDPNQSFDLSFYSSTRFSTGVRISSFKAIGANEKQVTQEANLNEKIVSLINIQPKPDGTIVIQVSMGGNYPNGNYYLNAMMVKPHDQNQQVDVTIHQLLINNREHDISNVYLVPQDYTAPTLDVNVEIADNSTLHSFPTSIDVSKPGLQTTTFVVEGADGQTKAEYTILVEKRFLFDELVVTRWNNTMSVINRNNPYGYLFSSYQWYKNGQIIRDANKQYYSAGRDGRWLDPNDIYHVEVKETNSGELMRCWESAPKLKNISMVAYPNPVSQNSVLTVDIDLEEELLQGAYINLYTSMGLKVKNVKAVQGQNQIEVPAGIGTYILILEGADGFRENIKLIVQ